MCYVTLHSVTHLYNGSETVVMSITYEINGKEMAVLWPITNTARTGANHFSSDSQLFQKNPWGVPWVWGGLRASLQHSVTRQFTSTRQSSLLCSKVLSDLLSRVLILMKGCTKNLHDLWSTLSGGTSASTPSRLTPQLIKRKSGLLRGQTAQLCGFISQETKTNRYVKRSLCWRTPLSRWKIVNPWLTCYPEFSGMRLWTPLPGSSHLNAELLTERRLSR